MFSFSCTDPKVWALELVSYSDLVENSGKEKLSALDKWYRLELPSLLRARQPSWIAQEELKKLMEWKLSRGKWRPRLLSFVSSLSNEDIRSASMKAFSALPNLKEAISHLSVLKGVGPATASAVLAAHSPSIAPFMSDEAVIAVLGNLKNYSMKEYLAYAQKVQDKAKELNAAEGRSREVQDLTASDVERALWAAAFKLQHKKSKNATKGGVGTANFGSKTEMDEKDKNPSEGANKKYADGSRKRGRSVQKKNQKSRTSVKKPKAYSK